MKDGSYVVIQSWMLTDLELKGNELLVYATIYGYTQDGEHWYYGTRRHLAEWCGATMATVSNCLASLVEKGLVERRERAEMGQVRVEYRATKNATHLQKNSTPPTKNFEAPLQKIGHINNKEDKAKDKKYINAPTLEEVMAYVAEKGYRFDPQHFFDYYEASGWKMQSGKPVKSWKQCCVTWERNCETKKGAENALSAYNFG